MTTPKTPSQCPPSSNWPHFDVWERVNALFYSLPNHFTTELVVKGIHATEIYSVGTAFSTVVDNQVVMILNRLRDIWDPDGRYANYAFVRQSQTFPDVLLRNLRDEQDILFGIELKSWYVLSKEGEPTFRYQVAPEACAEADLLVVIPWLLSDVISGSPTLLTPYRELARYAAQYRDYHWQKSRLDRGENPNIRKPPPKNRHPYPSSKQESSEEAEGDKGGNFGRIARAGIIDSFVVSTKAQYYLGIKVLHWIAFFKAISETSTDEMVDKRIQALKKKLKADTGLLYGSEEHTEYQDSFLELLERLEQLWERVP